MNSFLWVAAAVLFIVAVWFAWRYYDLKRRLNEYATAIRNQPDRLPIDLKSFENLSNSIASLKAVFDLELSTLESETSRLATVLEQLTDGVVIADSHGQVQFANPAARKLFDTNDPLNHSVAEVVRNHQLIEA